MCDNESQQNEGMKYLRIMHWNKSKYASKYGRFNNGSLLISNLDGILGGGYADKWWLLQNAIDKILCWVRISVTKMATFGMGFENGDWHFCTSYFPFLYCVYRSFICRWSHLQERLCCIFNSIQGKELKSRMYPTLCVLTFAPYQPIIDTSEREQLILKWGMTILWGKLGCVFIKYRIR